MARQCGLLAFLALYVTAPSGLSLAASQAPGSGWTMAPSADREIRHLYWQEFDRTEIWMRLTPRTPDGELPIPAILVVSAVLQGQVSLPLPSKTGARQVTLQAQANPRARVINPSLIFTTSEGKRLDLFEMGMASWLSASCEYCSATAVQAILDAPAFLALADNGGLTCEVLGFECELSTADTAALSEFGRAVRLLDVDTPTGPRSASS